MARKAIVDKDKILELLLEGETTQHIAEQFNVSRQAIDLHRKDFISRGLLADKRAIRRKTSATQPKYKPVSETRDMQQPELIPQASKHTIESISLDEQIDLLINAFSALKRISVLENELAVYKRENERILKEIEHLKSLERKRLEQENRWMLIQNEPGEEQAQKQNSMF